MVHSATEKAMTCQTYWRYPMLGRTMFGCVFCGRCNALVPWNGGEACLQFLSLLVPDNLLPLLYAMALRHV